MKWTILLFALFIQTATFANGAPSKSNAIITGVVTESGSTETLAGVRVSIVGTEIFTFSDKDGKFELSSVPAGNVQLSFSLVSFEKNKIQLTAAPNQKTDMSMELSPR
jgi:hypothetical protein